MENLKKLKQKVRYVLENYPDTRNSDIELTITVWKLFHSDKLEMYGAVSAVRLHNLFTLPREDHVKRIRAVIQNDQGEFLPTIWEVARKRQIEREKWESALGYKQSSFI